MRLGERAAMATREIAPAWRSRLDRGGAKSPAWFPPEAPRADAASSLVLPAACLARCAIAAPRRHRGSLVADRSETGRAVPPAGPRRCLPPLAIVESAGRLRWGRLPAPLFRAAPFVPPATR